MTQDKTLHWKYPETGSVNLNSSNYRLTNKASLSSSNLLKQGVWLYFLLLIFEGALRKWFLPFLSTPLLIVRDPIALILIYLSIKKGILKANWYISTVVFIGIASTFTALFLGHGNLAVALFGARIFLIHFPFLFVIGCVFDKQDVIKLGKFLLWLSIPMAFLVTLQFYSPQSAWVNRGVGGDTGGAGFSGALGYFRPPGTFSFTNGNTFLFSLIACFIFYFWLVSSQTNKLLLIVATLALLIVIPLSISRTLFFSVVITLAFTIFAVFQNPKKLGFLLLALFGGLILFISLSQTTMFQTGMEAFTARFTSANEAEGGLQGVLLDRYLGGMVGALIKSSQLPFWGLGLGMGTNVGSMLLTGDKVFLISEGEWGRLIGEIGPLMGLLVIFIRLSLTLKLVTTSYKSLLVNNVLPWLLLSFGLLTIPQGQWAQPTSLGFCTVIGGLIIASLKDKKIQTSKNLRAKS